MKKHLIKLIRISFFIFGCSTYICADCRTYFANRETREIIEMIKDEYDVKVGGLGGSFHSCRVNVIGLDFDIEKQMYLPEVRELLIEVKSKICKKVNKNKELLIYMPEHRCGQNNIDLGFSLHVKHKRPSDEYIALVSDWRTINYFHYDHQKKNLCHLLEESHEEAIEKLKGKME